MSERKLLTVPELAAELRLKKNTLDVWRITGRGPNFIKVGSLVRYRRADIEAWLRRQTVGAPT